MPNFNIREQEVVDMLGADPHVQQNLLNHQNNYPGAVQKILSALATTVDYRRQHPNPQKVPFGGARRPRTHYPIFFLDSDYVFREYLCVGIHEDGWVVLFRTALEAVLPRYQTYRYLSVIADWEGTSIPWLAFAVDVDVQRTLKLPNSSDEVGYDLYPIFLEKAYTPQPTP